MSGGPKALSLAPFSSVLMCLLIERPFLTTLCNTDPVTHHSLSLPDIWYDCLFAYCPSLPECELPGVRGCCSLLIPQLLGQVLSYVKYSVIFGE